MWGNHKLQRRASQPLPGSTLVGKHFFNEGLNSLDHVVSEGVFNVLKKAKKVAWHIDIGGGALLIRFFSLDSNYKRETHFIHGRKLTAESHRT